MIDQWDVHWLREQKSALFPAVAQAAGQGESVRQMVGCIAVESRGAAPHLAVARGAIQILGRIEQHFIVVVLCRVRIEERTGDPIQYPTVRRTQVDLLGERVLTRVELLLEYPERRTIQVETDGASLVTVPGV